jgi:hypothetical protein
MTLFESGFVKQAQEQGLSFSEAVDFLKRAMDHPAANSMFKQLPEDEEETDQDISHLAALLKQDLLDREMSTATKKIAV